MNFWANSVNCNNHETYLPSFICNQKPVQKYKNALIGLNVKRVYNNSKNKLKLFNFITLSITKIRVLWSTPTPEYTMSGVSA